MADRIELRGLVVRCVVGVHAWERKKPRELLLDVVIETDLGAAAASDAIAESVDYDALASDVRARIADAQPELIETVAGIALDTCLAHPRVAAAEVTVHKPGAIAEAADVAVTIRRTAPRRASRRTKRAR